MVLKTVAAESAKDILSLWLARGGESENELRNCSELNKKKKERGNNTASNSKFFFLDFENLGRTFARLNTPNVLETTSAHKYHRENNKNTQPLPYRLEWPNKKIYGEQLLS